MAKRAPQNTSVMAARAPGVVETDDAQTALYRRLEFFPTPPWATRAGAEIVKYLDPMAKEVSDPCCGEGHMAEVLKEFFPKVHASDVHNFGYGEVADYSSVSSISIHGCDWVIMNPPFKPAADFVRNALVEARRGVAVLGRLSFLESAERYPLFFKSKNPLSHVVYFVERVPMVLGRWNPKASTATAYAWFIFDKEYPRVRASEIMAIPPGTRARLTKPDDIRRFTKITAAPLFDGART